MSEPIHKCPACNQEPTIVFHDSPPRFKIFHECPEIPSALFQLNDGYSSPEAALEAFGKVFKLVKGTDEDDRLAHVMKENIALRLAIDDGMIALHDKLEAARKEIAELKDAYEIQKLHPAL